MPTGLMTREPYGVFRRLSYDRQKKPAGGARGPREPRRAAGAWRLRRERLGSVYLGLGGGAEDG